MRPNLSVLRNAEGNLFDVTHNSDDHIAESQSRTMLKELPAIPPLSQVVKVGYMYKDTDTDEAKCNGEGPEKCNDLARRTTLSGVAICGRVCR